MPTNANYAEEIQKLGMGAEVVLYEIDLTALGGPIIRVTPMTADGTELSEVSFGGEIYDAFPIIAEGFEWIAGQSPPQPTVTVSNIDHVFTSYVLEYGNLIGGRLTRIRTFEKFLDGGDQPDGDAHMPLDVYRIDRKTGHTEKEISWELASWIDHQGVMLPKRMVIRDYCPLRYRRWDATAGVFDYSKATCPYTGVAMFDRLNNATLDEAEDNCSHTMVGCRARFGEHAELPFGGFPGCAKFRL